MEQDSTKVGLTVSQSYCLHSQLYVYKEVYKTTTETKTLILHHVTSPKAETLDVTVCTLTRCKEIQPHTFPTNINKNRSGPPCDITTHNTQILYGGIPIVKVLRNRLSIPYSYRCIYTCIHLCTIALPFSMVYSLFRYKTKKVRDLWWLGLPPGVRGEVWKKALGNDLNISPGEISC